MFQLLKDDSVREKAATATDNIISDIRRTPNGSAVISYYLIMIIRWRQRQWKEKMLDRNERRGEIRIYNVYIYISQRASRTPFIVLNKITAVILRCVVIRGEYACGPFVPWNLINLFRCTANKRFGLPINHRDTTRVTVIQTRGAAPQNLVKQNSCVYRTVYTTYNGE